EPFAQPHIEITQNEPLIFKATVPLPPAVKLGDYLKIKVARKPIKVSKDDVTAAIEQLRHQHATWEPVERPVAFGDLLTLDVDSTVENETLINQKGAQYQVVRDAPFPALGFAEQLVEMKREEEKEFKLSLPPDYPKSELAGKEASFKVAVAEIKQEKLPELNDEFAKGLSADLENLSALQEQVKTNMKLRAEDKARADFEEQLVDAVVDISELEFPPILVELEINRLINQQMQRWQAAGRSPEEYLSSIGKTEEELRKELRPSAARRVNWSLVLGDIAEKEKIEANDSEIDTEIENMMKGAGENKERLQQLMNTPQSRESLQNSLITRKTIQRLEEIAGGSKAKDKTKKKEENK
ncbi:trigger factor, partial [Chloroflexota bacterium]